MSCRPTGGRKTRKYESKTTGGRVTPASYRALNMYCSGRGVVLLSLENLPGGRSQRCRTTGSCHNQPYKPLVLLISTGSRALCPALLCLRTAECQDSFVTSFFLFFLFLFQFLTLFCFANTLVLILHSAPDSELSITLRISSLNSDWCSQQSVQSTTLFWQVLSFDKNWPLWKLVNLFAVTDGFIRSG